MSRDDTADRHNNHRHIEYIPGITWFICY